MSTTASRICTLFGISKFSYSTICRVSDRMYLRTTFFHSRSAKGGCKLKESVNRPKSRTEQVNPALMHDNQVLALSVNRQEVEQRTRFIREYGLLTPPVVGQLHNGTCKVLTGEWEFLSLREMESRTAEAVIVFVDETDKMDRLSLQLHHVPQSAKSSQKRHVGAAKSSSSDSTRKPRWEICSESPLTGSTSCSHSLPACSRQSRYWKQKSDFVPTARKTVERASPLLEATVTTILSFLE